MTLKLFALDKPFDERGIYGPLGTHLPKRMRWLDFYAASSLERMEEKYPGVFHYSDVFRDAEGSRQARISRKGAKRPGFSGHNFGLSKDDDVGDNMRRLEAFLGGPVTKADYDALMREFGWWCHRDGPRGGDHKREAESWHFNFLGDNPTEWLRMAARTTEGALEYKIASLYGPFVVEDGAELQRLLQIQPLDKGRYDGKVDGVIGPKTTAAIRDFQRYWGLEIDGAAGLVTQRVLIYVSADIDWIESIPF